jgi:hypothetical protein
LFIDDGEGDTEMEINYCPMCGRKLWFVQ